MCFDILTQQYKLNNKVDTYKLFASLLDVSKEQAFTCAILVGYETRINVAAMLVYSNYAGWLKMSSTGQ